MSSLSRRCSRRLADTYLDVGSGRVVPPIRHALVETVVRHELSVLALIRGKERFIYVYDDDSRDELIETIRAQAADPTVSLSWYDAAVLVERARQQADDPGTQPSPPAWG